MSAGAYAYVGGELDLFARAACWKGYLARRTRPYVRGAVLEVGAGIGATTRALYTAAATRWVCLEPDPALAERLRAERARGALPPRCEVACGTLADVGAGDFDCLLYIDVLEHIADDAAEVGRAAARLRLGGHLVVLSPAHPWLFTPFDRAVGHHRRYTRGALRALTPPSLRVERLDYLDAVGFFASAVNRLVLRSAMPSAAQVRFWDGVLVRASRVVDPLLGYRAGKSVLAVWRRA